MIQTLFISIYGARIVPNPPPTRLQLRKATKLLRALAVAVTLMLAVDRGFKNSLPFAVKWPVEMRESESEAKINTGVLSHVGCTECVVSTVSVI